MLVTNGLKDAGKDDKSLALVLSTEFLPVTPLLLRSPQSHLDACHDHEQGCGEEATLADEGVDYPNADPRDDLEQIVGTGDPIEAEALGNTTSLRVVGWSQATQNQVCVEVSKLANGKQGDGSVYGQWVGVNLGLRRAVGEDGQVETRQQPIVTGVLEYVEGRHGGIGETVDEESLQLSLQEMDGHHGERELL